PPGRDLPPLRGGQSLPPFVPRSEARGEGAPRSGVGGDPEGVGQNAPFSLPPTSPAPLALRRAGTFPHFVGDKACAPLSPGAKRGGKGPPRSGVGGGPQGRANPCPLECTLPHLPPLRGGQSLPVYLPASASSAVREAEAPPTTHHLTPPARVPVDSAQDRKLPPCFGSTARLTAPCCPSRPATRARWASTC